MLRMAGFAHEIMRGIEWGIGRRFVNLLPVWIIVLVVVVVGIYFVVKWFKNRD